MSMEMEARKQQSMAGSSLLLLLFVAHVVADAHFVADNAADSQPGTLVTAPRRWLAARRRPPLGSGFWTVHGSNFFDAHRRLIRFSGVQWAGFETPEAALHGLGVRSLSSHLDQMASLGFNVLRLSFAGDTLLPSTYPQNINYYLNPDLQGLNSLQLMDKVIAACGHRGIRVILDYHRLHLTVSNEYGLWYDANAPESTWIHNWVMLARRYRGNPTVVGADLFNEVHPGPGMPQGAPYWARQGTVDEKYNFRSAVQRVVNAIQSVNRDWILFVEGMHNNYWWGGNCAQILRAPPLTLKVPNKLALSAHEYGPYVYDQAWFNAPNFPKNLPRVFTRHWGAVALTKKYPVWVGEFGSFLPPANSAFNTKEREAFITLVNYIRILKLSWTLAFWGPDSKDTGGVLTDDWVTPNHEKLRLLARIMHRGFGPSPGQKN